MRGFGENAGWFALVVLAAAVVCGQPPDLSAQSGSSVQQPPVLEETEVVADPARGAAASPAGPTPAPGPSGPAFGESVLNNSIFASPEGEGYAAESSTSGTLIDVPNLDLPATVSVVTDDLIRDQQAVRIEDILRDIPGAVKADDQLRPDSFFVRGFQLGSRDFRRDGFLDPTFSPRDLVNVERIEVLKGPASVLFGPGQPSGIINFITKEPQAEAYQRATYQFGSFGLERYTFDTTGAVTEEGRPCWSPAFRRSSSYSEPAKAGTPTGQLLYRFIGAYEDRQSFRDFFFEERFFLNPQLTWLVNRDTAITWKSEIIEDRRRFDTGVAAINGDVEALPIERFLGEPDRDMQQFRDYRQWLVLEHKLNDCWQVRVGGNSLFYEAPSVGTFPAEFVGRTPFGPSTFTRSRQRVGPFRESYHSAIFNLAGEFEAGGLEHKLVLGTEQGWFISNEFRSFNSDTGFTPLFIDAEDPVYRDPLALTFPSFISTFRENRHGYFLQDLAELSPQWKVLGGVRFDNARQVFVRQIPIVLPQVRNDETFERWSPRVGLIYQPIPDVLSFYGMYSKSFSPAGGGPRADEDPLLPELGDIYEAGIKAELFEGLTLTAGGFYIERQNVTIDKVEEVAPFMFVFTTDQIGLQRSQGVEVSMLGQITERWSVSNNWALTDTRLFDETDPTLDGKRARNVPLHTVNLWSRYNLLQCCHQTLGVALGMIHQQDRLGDLATPLILPEFTRWDAALYYQRGRLDASLYLENLFDERYYTGSINALQITPGAPLNARAMVGVTY